ncbi:hypothetical protein KS4_33350 [Poriferisphaera corsica]|uniref:Uncharacterized protein n=1 Tax=Poriferisphaera corsica TaxID=2528020 RepID=A0A517YYF7_9BACT|nr:hypothetical protein KS4_33350 [Poriferisphaera corsica]
MSRRASEKALIAKFVIEVVLKAEVHIFLAGKVTTFSG